MARKRKSSSAQAATGSGAGAAGKSRAQRKAPVARRAKSSTGRRVPVRVPAKARRAAQLRRAGDGGGDDSSEASGEASDSDAEEAPAAGAGADASDASDSGASNGSDEDEAEYSSEYGSSDLDESSGDEAGAGGGASKGDTAVAQAAYSTPAVTASSGVRGYGSWIKGQRLDENGVLKQYQPTGSELRMHVDDLSSDDEEAKNTIGNVPLEWYNDYDHIGYDVAGRQVAKPAPVSGIDRFLQSQDDPNFRWRIMDERNGEEITLSRREVELLRRIQTNKFPHPEFNAYPDYDPWFSSVKEIHPLHNPMEPKRRFQPSKWEKKKIVKIMKRMREGTYKVDRPKPKPTTFLLWGEDDSAIGFQKRYKAPQHIPAPKLKLPGHAASYNPPDEYLLTDEEKKAWEEMDPERRPLPFMPTKYKTLRHVPLYHPLIKERFNRCLDLYLCPRAVKRRLQVDPETLLPKLPSPEELRPYPTTEAIEYNGHTGRVRTMTVDPTGQWLVTGSDDMTVRLWEVDTGREMHQWKFEATIQHVVWNPNPAIHIVAVAIKSRVVLLSTGTAVGADMQTTFDSLSGARAEVVRAAEGDSDAEDSDSEAKAAAASKEPTWESTDITTAAELDGNTSATVVISHNMPVKRIHWHRKGDYLATVSPHGNSKSVTIHNVPRRKSQTPFKRNMGLVQCVAFHPSKPLFYCANQRNIRVYNLLTQSLEKKLVSGCKWISSMDVHPTGDHIIVSSYDKKVVWFDLELSSQPFKTLRYSKEAVRQVSFHTKYPLMASTCDDGSVHVLHSKVFGDFLQNPLIVPVKVIKAHRVTSDKLGVLSCAWHPSQPWLFTSGADHAVKLFQNIP